MFEIYLNVYGELREFAYLDRDPKYDEQYDDVNSRHWGRSMGLIQIKK